MSTSYVDDQLSMSLANEGENRTHLALRLDLGVEVDGELADELCGKGRRFGRCDGVEFCAL